MFDIGLGHYLSLGAIMFTIGLIGIFLNRKNVIVLLMSIELILLAVNINLVSFSIFINDLSGQIFTLFILTVAAAEAAIGLAIIVVYFRNAGTIRVEEIEKLKEENRRLQEANIEHSRNFANSESNVIKKQAEDIVKGYISDRDALEIGRAHV